MSNSFYDELGELVAKHRTADETAEKEQAEAKRLDALNAKIDALTDAVTNRLTTSPPSPAPPTDGSGTGDPPQPSSPGSADPPNTDDPPPPELPVQRVTKSGVPKVYTGDDEPAEVEYIDEETGETRKRPGRKKGHPSVWLVENVEPTPSE